MKAIALKRRELLQALAESSGAASKEVLRVLDALVRLIEREARIGHVVKVPGLGAFSLAKRKGRVIMNPATRELMHLAETRTVAFRPSKSVKRAVAT